MPDQTAPAIKCPRPAQPQFPLGALSLSDCARVMRAPTRLIAASYGPASPQIDVTRWPTAPATSDDVSDRYRKACAHMQPGCVLAASSAYPATNRRMRRVWAPPEY